MCQYLRKTNITVLIYCVKKLLLKSSLKYSVLTLLAYYIKYLCEESIITFLNKPLLILEEEIIRP